MEKNSHHDTPFLCDYCQAHPQMLQRVEDSKLELLRVKEHEVLHIKSKRRPCECKGNNSSKLNVDQKANQSLQRQKRPKPVENVPRLPNRNYEKELESVAQEPSTSKAYSFRERTEREQWYLPEEATPIDRNEPTTPKLCGSRSRTVSKISKESAADAQTSPRKSQTRESSKRRKETHVNKSSTNSKIRETPNSPEYSHEQINPQKNQKSEGSELESHYTYSKSISGAKEKGTRPSLIPVIKQRLTPRVLEITNSNSSQEIEIIKPSTFKERVSEYKLLEISEISITSKSSQGSAEQKLSQFEDQKGSDKVSQTNIEQHNIKTKTPPLINPKPKPHKWEILKENQQFMQIETNKEGYQKNEKSAEYANYTPVLELSENTTLKYSDSSNKSVRIPQNKQSTVEQSRSTISMNRLIVSSPESEVSSPKAKLSARSIRSSSYILEKKGEMFESNIQTSLLKFSEKTKEFEKVDSIQFLQAQERAKESKATTKYSNRPYENLPRETESITDQQKCGTTESYESLPELNNNETSNDCSYVPIIKRDSFEPIQQDCRIQMQHERPPEVASSPDNIIHRCSDSGASSESNLSEELKEYEPIRNYRSRSSIKPDYRQSNLEGTYIRSFKTDVISNSLNSNDSEIFDKLGRERKSLSLKRDNEEDKQLSNEMSDSENDQLHDFLSMIFKQAKKEYEKRKLSKDAKLFEEKLQIVRLYEYMAGLNEKYDPCEEKLSHGNRKPYKKRHSLTQSLKSIEHPVTYRIPELSSIIERTDSEQLQMQNTTRQRQQHQRENMCYEYKKRERDIAGITESNEYRQRSDLDNRLLKPFKYPTCMYEKPLQDQPKIKMYTPRPRSLRSKQTQTLPEVDHAHWEHSKISSKGASKKHKSMNIGSEESEELLENMSLKQTNFTDKQDPLSELTGNNETIIELETDYLLTNYHQSIDQISSKSLQDAIEYAPIKDSSLKQNDAGISLGSPNRRERRTSETMNLEKIISQKEKRSSSHWEPPKNQRKNNDKCKNNTESKILENKESKDCDCDCDCALETVVELRMLMNNESPMKKKSERSEREILLKRSKKKNDAPGFMP